MLQRGCDNSTAVEQVDNVQRGCDNSTDVRLPGAWPLLRQAALICHDLLPSAPPCSSLVCYCHSQLGVSAPPRKRQSWVESVFPKPEGSWLIETEDPTPGP